MRPKVDLPAPEGPSIAMIKGCDMRQRSIRILALFMSVWSRTVTEPRAVATGPGYAGVPPAHVHAAITRGGSHSSISEEPVNELRRRHQRWKGRSKGRALDKLRHESLLV